ncbi:hypothetical protein [Aliirhizobium smilacinae]|uniref:Methyltransferase domain-containing protein n=1 Tax=Aliirhizobium smilacinae TaxID=1395944 RepID=A0A5C4XTX2_9HYPH|nr:hypothetical protein [Rhizobium smilacinae]TNM66154.1 hypothetical protein FHP24_08065 [Rhizobium smilacinae]
MQEHKPRHLDVDQLLNLVNDESARPDLEKKISDPALHMKAMLRSVYEERRWRAQHDFFDAVYRDYQRDDLRERPFLIYGPGNFRHKHWQTADVIRRLKQPKSIETMGGSHKEIGIDHAWKQHYDDPLSIEDNSINVVYASHVVDYASNKNNDFFFKDVHRILRIGGVFRLTSCDVDLGLRAAKTADFAYYGMSHIQRGESVYRRTLGLDGKATPIEWYILESCSLVTRKENSTYYPPELCADFLWSDDNVYNALDLATELSDSPLREAIGGRVNWSNPNKITGMLREAGFSEVMTSSYGQSCCPVLRDTRYFDTINPGMSWYVEAIK